MKFKRLTAVLLALCLTIALLPTTALAVTPNKIYAVSYGHGVVSADTYSAEPGTLVTVTLSPDANRLHMGQGSTSVDPGPDYVMQKQMEADMKYVSDSPSGTVADVNSAIPDSYTEGTPIDSDDYSGAASYYPINFVFAITNDSNATVVSLTKKTDTTYTFTMPDTAVKIVAGFGSVTTEPAGARVPAEGSWTQTQEGNPGDRISYLDFQVETRTDLKCLYYPSYIENVFDFTDGKTLQIVCPADGEGSTYGSFLLNVLGVARDYSGTKQISLSETSFALPDSLSAADAQKKMFSVTGDGNGNFSVSCLLISNSVITSSYYTAITSHELKSKQVDSYVYSPNSLFVGDPDASMLTSIVDGYYYLDRLTTISAYKSGISFAFKYGSDIADDVILGGINLVNDNDTTYWVNNTETGSVKSNGATSSNYNAKYEPSTRTLTIHDLNVEGSFNNTALYANCDLNVVVDGTNSIINNYTNQDASSFGISILGSLSFSGSGALTTKAGSGSGVINASIGIYSGNNLNIALTGGTINTYGRSAKNVSYGICSSAYYSQNAGNTTVTSGTLNAYGGATTSNAETCTSIGIYSDNTFTASGGTTTATGGTSTGTSANSYGIFAFNAEISSAVTATGGPAHETSGIESYHVLIKDGASVTATGGSGDDSSGIYVSANSTEEPGTIVITGGEVIARADSTAPIHVAFNIQPAFSDTLQTDANWCMWRLSNSGSYTSNVNTPYTVALGNSHVEIKADTNVTGVVLSTNTPTVDTQITTNLAPSSATADYQWYTNTSSSTTGGTLISGATTASYTPQASDVGKYLYIVATGTGSYTGSAKAATTNKVTFFTSVKDIAMTSAASVQVNTGLTLAGAVTPENATNKSIVWSVANAGATGATVANGVFKATAAGTATVKATILNGTAQGTDYSETFKITVTPSQDPEPIKYTIEKGANSKWTKGSNSGLSFTTNGAFSKFTGVTVNGVLLSASNYTASSGNTVVSLKPAYLSTLSSGTYDLTIVFSDGEASTQFEVKDADMPQTSDNGCMTIWFYILLVSSGILGAIGIMSHRRKHTREK